MKSALPYILVLAATFLLSGLVVIGTLMFRPDLLRSSTVPPVPDSVAMNVGPKYLREFAGPTGEELSRSRGPKVDAVALMRDSMHALVASLEDARKAIDTLNQKARVQMAVTPPSPVDTVARQKEKKSRAKMLESMPAEEAAKILMNLTDEETKELLKLVKARQAAKIIAAIRPERASRLFR